MLPGVSHFASRSYAHVQEELQEANPISRGRHMISCTGGWDFRQSESVAVPLVAWLLNHSVVTSLTQESPSPSALCSSNEWVNFSTAGQKSSGEDYTDNLAGSRGTTHSDWSPEVMYLHGDVKCWRPAYENVNRRHRNWIHHKNARCK